MLQPRNGGRVVVLLDDDGDKPDAETFGKYDPNPDERSRLSTRRR
jgi:hypothetical protein